MKALVLENPGSDPTLVLQAVARPEPGPGEVLVRVEAAGLNFRDLLMAKNRLPGAADFIVGGDAAGVVAAFGAGVSRWLPGDRVVLHPDRSCGDCEYCQSGRQYFCEQRRSLGYALDGTFAEYVRVPGVSLPGAVRQGRHRHRLIGPTTRRPRAKPSQSTGKTASTPSGP